MKQITFEDIYTLGKVVAENYLREYHLKKGQKHVNRFRPKKVDLEKFQIDFFNIITFWIFYLK
ncbi:hypothetical protein ACIQD3_20835 [Peribacillus loiseleuriae]|uniref:hypothetical protein n=1 Tax=Peribacillus loiseleuriae TaxID=1679170 RepID=UPI003819B1C8